MGARDMNKSWFMVIGLIVLCCSCGYVKIFNGENDEYVSWNPEKGFEQIGSPDGSFVPADEITPDDNSKAAELCATELDTEDLAFAAGDSGVAITKSFTLPDSISDCSVSWSLSASDSAYISVSGSTATVTRPRSIADKTVSLVATVRSGSAVARKTLSVTVKSGVIDEASFEDANACQSGFSSSNITLAGGDTASAVTQDFTLPTSVVINGATCSISSWSSSDSAISLSGNTATVSRPADSSSNETVTLTSYVSVNGETAALPITVTLSVKKYTEAETLSSCVDALTADDFTGITKTSNTGGTVAAAVTSISFPTTLTGSAGTACSVSWVSNNTPYLSVSGGTGTVTHENDASNTTVTLTPTVTRGSETDASKVFTIVVKSKFTSAKSLSAFDNTGGKLGVTFAAATSTDNAVIVNYKVCYSQTEADLNTPTTMDTLPNCQVESSAYPNIETPLDINVGAIVGQTWYARVYAFIVGAPSVDSKKILYQLGTAEFN